jgi:Anti-sigma factor NepR
LARIRFLTEVLENEKLLELQGLNSRGNVEQVMKDVKSQASKTPAPGKQGGLNAEIQSRIGHQLRAMYDDVVRQGVPDRFADLIRKLDGPAAAHQISDGGESGPSGHGGINNQEDGRD